ncbi:hypothetical protein [Microbacterium aurugineum]|uniref:hypothetical protein n=1 Tax=uncultured Microbacterium sp. TaxID=191216 RepID=UPI0025DD498E|nr:hypothetical protein [uncultured Microbacterium sp.]
MLKALVKLSADVRDFWIDRIWLDYVIAAAIVGAHLLLILWWPWLDVLAAASAPDRRAVYSAAAIVVSLLGSFSAVAIGQLGSAKGERADTLREAGGADLARNWRSVFRTALLCALIAIFGLLLDPSNPPAVTATSPQPLTPEIIRWIFEAGLVLAVVRFVRLSALFVEVLEVASLGGTDAPSKLAAPPVPDPDWAKRRRTGNGN